MRDEFKPVYKGFIDKYGIRSQRQQSIEEMSELIKELCKFERYAGTDAGVRRGQRQCFCSMRGRG